VPHIRPVVVGAAPRWAMLGEVPTAAAAQAPRRVTTGCDLVVSSEAPEASPLELVEEAETTVGHDWWSLP